MPFKFPTVKKFEVKIDIIKTKTTKKTKTGVSGLEKNLIIMLL